MVYWRCCCCGLDIAVCYDGFCKNGGNCSSPNVSCTCPDDWKGSQCQKGLTGVIVLVKIHILVHLSAVCSQNFCKYLGTCLYPNINCTCLFMFKGNTCGEGIFSSLFFKNGVGIIIQVFILTVNYFITTLILAATILLMTLSITLHCIRKCCQKSDMKETR